MACVFPRYYLIAHSSLFEFADLYVSEGDGKAVVLKVDDSVVHVREVGIDLELAVCDEFAELG